MLKTGPGRIRIQHLENDVTKALLNVFQHCSKKVLATFLSLISVKQSADTFEFDFQITDTLKYRSKRERIMLSVISAATARKSDPNYKVEQSQPDACLFNKDTAILIEAKTQSPLIFEQVDNHIKHYFGSATKESILTWEEIVEKFRLISNGLDAKDNFLLTQFCEFLDLIGLAEFNGFVASDFSTLGSISQFRDEDYLDFKRLFRKKVEKFMALLNEEIGLAFDFVNYGFKIGQVNSKAPDTWSAFYFYNNDPDTHVNYYPNVNIDYTERGIGLSLNAEIQSSVKCIVSSIKRNPKLFNKAVKRLNDFRLLLFYKYQYLPKDNFVWNLLPGYPKDITSLDSNDVLSDMASFQDLWSDYRHTLQFEMTSGVLKHASGRFFTEKEIAFAGEKNTKPNYIIRIEKRYEVHELSRLKRKVVSVFKKEISLMKDLVRLVNLK